MSFPVAFAVVMCLLELIAVSVVLWLIWKKRDKS